jgi:hypothetical protein
MAKKKVKKVSKKSVKNNNSVGSVSNSKKINNDVVMVGGMGGKRVQINPKKRLGIALYNFVFFLVLSIVSYLFYSVSNEEIFVNLFFLLYILFGFLSVAFLIASLIFFILKR